MVLLNTLVEYVQTRTHYSFYKNLRNATTKQELKKCLIKGCEFSGSSSKKMSVIFMGRTDNIVIKVTDENGNASEGIFTWDQLTEAVYSKEVAQQQGINYSFSEQITLF